MSKHSFKFYALNKLIYLISRYEHNIWDITGDRITETVKITDKDKCDYLENIFWNNCTGEKKYAGFILLDSLDIRQSETLKSTLIPILKKVGIELKLVHKSNKFCNRGHYYGNVLTFYIFEVIKNES